MVEHAIDRTHVDDGAAARGHHGTRHGLADQESALEIDAQHGVEVCLGHIQKIGRAKNARVVHQHVDASMGCERLGHQRVHLRLVAHIAMHIQRPQLTRQHFTAHIVHIDNHATRPLGRKPAHAGLPNPLRRARDEAYAAAMAEMTLETFKVLLG